MGKKYTLSQQKARDRQRVVTERIRKEKADAAASALREVTAKKEADAENYDAPAPAASAQSVMQTLSPSSKPQRFEAGPSESQTVVPAKDSSIATPVTPTRASIHPTATQRDGSTDESASESADSELADLMQEDPEAQGKQAYSVTHSCTGESEVGIAAPATTAPQTLPAAETAPTTAPTADVTPVIGNSIGTSTSLKASTTSGSSTIPAVSPDEVAALTGASSFLENLTSPDMSASTDGLAKPDASATPDNSATPDPSTTPDASAIPIVSATPDMSAFPGASTSPVFSSTPTASGASASPDPSASTGDDGSAGVDKVKPSAKATCEQPAQVELTCKDKVGMPVSLPIHACTILQTCFHQSWIPEGVQSRVNAAATAGVNITAAVAALVMYWKH